MGQVKELLIEAVEKYIDETYGCGMSADTREDYFIAVQYRAMDDPVFFEKILGEVTS